MPQQLRQPAGCGGLALGERGEFRLLELFPGRCRGLLSRLLQGFKYLKLADTVEVVFSGRREPCGHVEVEHGGELDGVNQSRGIRSVGFHLHGVDRAGGTEGQEVDENGLLLLKAPRPVMPISA